MKKTLAEWIKEANKCQFPMTAASQHGLNKLLENEENIKVEDLLTLVRLDPGIAINLLRYAGTKQKREVTTVSHAILLISIPGVIKLIQSLPVLEEQIDTKLAYKIKRLYFYQHMTGMIAMSWSIIRKESENNELFAAGLNRSFAHLFLYLNDTTIADELYKFSSKKMTDVINKETELIGFTVDQLSKAIAEAWNLPYLIKQSYDNHHHNPKVNGLRLADELVRWMYFHKHFDYPEKLLEQISQYLRLPVAKTPAQINYSIVKTLRATYDNLPHGSMVRALMCFPISIKEKTKPLSINKKKILLNRLKHLRKALPSLEYKSAIKAYIDAIYDYFGPTKLAFLQYDDERQYLGKAITAKNAESKKIKKVTISLELNRLFKQLIKKESLLLIEEKNKKKYFSHMPPGLLSITNNGVIILHTIVINRHINGCIVMQQNEKLSFTQPEELKIYKTICKELKNAIKVLQNSNQSRVA